MMPERTIAPEARTLERISFRIPDPIGLLDGWKVYCIDEGDQDVIRLEWIFEAGSWYQQKALQAFAAIRMLPEGAAGRTAREIHEMLDYHGAYLDTSNDHHSSSITLYALNKHLPSLLPLLRDILFSPSFPEKEFEVFSNKTLQDFRVNMEKVNYLARRNFLRLLYGDDHPYGRMLSEEDIVSLNASDIRTFYDERYRDGCKLIASGRLPSNLLDLLAKHFNDTKISAGLPEGPEHDGYVYTPGRTHIRRIGALQSAIRVGLPLFNKVHPDFHGFSVLNTILGGYFGSRLMSNLREEKGYTYGINSGLVSMRKSGYFFVSSQVGAEYQENAISEIASEIDRLRQEPVSHAELDLVRNYLMGSLARAYDGAFAKAERLRTYIDLDIDHKHLELHTQVIRDITPAEIQDLAIKYLKNEPMIQLSVGP